MNLSKAQSVPTAVGGQLAQAAKDRWPTKYNASNTWAFFTVIYADICRLDIRKFSFARRVCPVWNALSYDVVNSCSVSSFKRKQ